MRTFFFVLSFLKQAVDVCIYAANDFSQIFWVFHKVDVVDIDDEQFSLVVLRNPRFVAFVQPAEVVDADGVFISPSAFVNLPN